MLKYVLLLITLDDGLMAEAFAADFGVNSLTSSGAITWSNAYSNGICTIETADQPLGPWWARQNLFTTHTVGATRVDSSASNQFIRLLALDISTNSSQGFSNLVMSYGRLHTIAGNGAGRADVINYWQSTFENGPATNAALSRPHFAMSDGAGNIYIADKDSHAVLKVTTNGTIHTVAGTHVADNGQDKPDYGTNVALNSPTGLWVLRDGTVFILDTNNGKVRQLTPAGIVSTLFTFGRGLNINTGRGLWVSDDATLAYLANGTNVVRWTRAGGFSIFSSGFVDLGNLALNAQGRVVVTDRGASRVYRLHPDGSSEVMAGNGSTKPVVEGALAKKAGVYGVRGIWFLPNQGYLFATHEGSQILYVDPEDKIHVFLDGKMGTTHAGDGQWFYSHGNKIAEARSVTMDFQGNLIIVENDAGYVRKIDFQRLSP
jgi:hypothetical protein